MNKNETANNFKLNLDETDEINAALFEYLKNNKSVNVDMIDEIKKQFITINYKNESLKVPFKYIIINTNKKLNGIPYINFEVDCSSKKLNLCSICKNCYSLKDQKRFKANNFKIILNVLFFKEVQKNQELLKAVINYLNNFALVRYNCNNDLNNINNFKFLITLANNLKNTIFAGYTKRTDLLKDINKLNRPVNLVLNGSGYMIDNNYNSITDLKTYIKSGYTCGGICRNCLKCFKPRNKNIYTLLHGSLNSIDKYFNTADNRAFLIASFKKIDIKLTADDLKINKGLILSLNKSLKDYNLKFKNYNELVIFLKEINKGC